MRRVVMLMVFAAALGVVLALVLPAGHHKSRRATAPAVPSLRIAHRR